MKFEYRRVWVNLWQLRWPLCLRVIQVVSFLLLCFGSTEMASADRGLLDFSGSPQPTDLPTNLVVATQAANSPTHSFTETGKLKRKLHQAETLNFDLPKRGTSKPSPTREPTPAIAPAATAPVSKIDPTHHEMAALFVGGSDSLVAKAVGTAEGTRTPTGDKTWAYYGHVDPGNGVWNLGSFSYQHGAKTLEEADQKQLQRLERQAAELRRQAAAQGLALTLEEELNGIDLANQAPLAALDTGGYIDWLKEAHKAGLRGSDAVLWARTRSFINPKTGTWNAPGLGNNIYSISRDQERRLQAIARAVAAHQTQHLNASNSSASVQFPPDTQQETSAASPPNREAIADHLIYHSSPRPVSPTSAEALTHSAPAVLEAPGLHATPTQTTAQERIAAQIIHQDLDEKPATQTTAEQQSSGVNDSSATSGPATSPRTPDPILQID